MVGLGGSLCRIGTSAKIRTRSNYSQLNLYVYIYVKIVCTCMFKLDGHVDMRVFMLPCS